MRLSDMPTPTVSPAGAMSYSPGTMTPGERTGIVRGLARLDGHGKDIEALIKLGIDKNQLSHRGETPLHAAAESGNTEAFNALLPHFDPRIPNRNGDTVFHIAAREEKASEIMKVLMKIAKPADLELKAGPPGRKQTPLEWSRHPHLRKNAELIERKLADFEREALDLATQQMPAPTLSPNAPQPRRMRL